MERNSITLERTVVGRPIRAEVRFLDSGLHALITGGDRSHVGAVSWAEPGSPPRSHVFPGHRDQVISERWAGVLAELGRCRALVVCGIHYDSASTETISAVVQASEEMLREVRAALSVS